MDSINALLKLFTQRSEAEILATKASEARRRTRVTVRASLPGGAGTRIETIPGRTAPDRGRDGA